MKRAFFYLLALCFLVSCDTEDEIIQPVYKTFSGVVLDYSTGTPVPGVLVKIVRLEYTDQFRHGFNSGLIRDLRSSVYVNLRVDSVVTDNNGKYSVDLDVARPPYNSYFIGVYKEGYIHTDTLPPILSRNREVLYDTAYIDKSSYLKLTINNSAPASALDTLVVRTFYQGVNGESRYYRFAGINDSIPSYSDSSNFIGITTNGILMDTISFKAFPQARVQWTTWKNGLATSRDTTMVLTEFGVKALSIDY